MDGQGYATDVKLEGVYNLYNAAAALAVVRAVMQDNAAASKATAAANACAVSADELIAAVSRVTPAFGRGEVIDVNGSPVELLLVKNPMGFRLSLASFDPANADTMIAINDEYADGRDMSWLWDVDFTSLRASGVAMVSGVPGTWHCAWGTTKCQSPIRTPTSNRPSPHSSTPIPAHASTSTAPTPPCSKPAPYWAASPKYGTRAWASNYPLAPARHLPPAGGHGEE